MNKYSSEDVSICISLVEWKYNNEIIMTLWNPIYDINKNISSLPKNMNPLPYHVVPQIVVFRVD